MNSFMVLDRQARYVFMAVLIVFATVASALMPVLASAAQVTARSVELSSSSADANNVTYNVKFTPVAGAAAFVVDFCSNSPLVGSECTPPTGFSATNAASTTSGFTTVEDLAANTVKVTGTITTSAVAVELTGIDNPTAAGPLYARIVTYSDALSASSYTSEDLGDDVIDSGSVAISINPTIGVSAAVLESLTFCMSAPKADDGTNPIGANCTGTLVAPNLKLGETNDSVTALDSSAVSTTNLFTQLSTNAVGGAVVSLKSGVSCGGLKRANVSTCDIAPAQQTGIAQSEAKFGVRVAADGTKDTALGATGTLQAKSGSGYNGSTYALNFDDDDETGITSPYGDPILDTNNTLLTNRNMTFTFGASISNATPAGNYSADLSLIATGTF